MNKWHKAKIESGLAQKKIVWKISSPGAPHFGGVWERLDRSFKKVKIAILGNHSLKDEVFSTIMFLVEQTLNARTLTALSDDPEDLTALTSNHILLGRENASASFLPFSDCYHDLRNLSRQLKHMPTLYGKHGLVNTFHNGTIDRSGQKNMYETWEKAS